jgi:hypothetical protein
MLPPGGAAGHVSENVREERLQVTRLTALPLTISLGRPTGESRR